MLYNCISDVTKIRNQTMYWCQWNGGTGQFIPGTTIKTKWPLMAIDFFESKVRDQLNGHM